MGRAAAQVPALMVRVTVAAVLTLGSKVIKAIKAIRVVTINSQVRGINNSNLGIRVTQSS